jgi:hypothetical protein
MANVLCEPFPITQIDILCLLKFLYILDAVTLNEYQSWKPL